MRSIDYFQQMAQLEAKSFSPELTLNFPNDEELSNLIALLQQSNYQQLFEKIGSSENAANLSQKISDEETSEMLLDHLEADDLAIFYAMLQAKTNTNNLEHSFLPSTYSYLKEPERESSPQDLAYVFMFADLPIEILLKTLLDMNFVLAVLKINLFYLNEQKLFYVLSNLTEQPYSFEVIDLLQELIDKAISKSRLDVVKMIWYSNPFKQLKRRPIYDWLSQAAKNNFDPFFHFIFSQNPYHYLYILRAIQLKDIAVIDKIFSCPTAKRITTEHLFALLSYSIDCEFVEFIGFVFEQDKIRINYNQNNQTKIQLFALLLNQYEEKQSLFIYNLLQDQLLQYSLYKEPLNFLFHSKFTINIDFNFIKKYFIELVNTRSAPQLLFFLQFKKVRAYVNIRLIEELDKEQFVKRIINKVSLENIFPEQLKIIDTLLGLVIFKNKSVIPEAKLKHCEVNRSELLKEMFMYFFTVLQNQSMIRLFSCSSYLLRIPDCIWKKICLQIPMDKECDYHAISKNRALLKQRQTQLL